MATRAAERNKIKPLKRGDEDACKQLWCAVLFQAMVDARLPSPLIHEGLGQKAMVAARQRVEDIRTAKSFLTKDIHPWRATVCDMADVNEESFTKRGRLIVFGYGQKVAA